ncbi:DUF4175 family protein [Tenacibaculum sp. SG-28]|uniref:DUF4175 family protein n=1 Tax=Tenacibaculum sp. SG-28 TaxID=754426 RepID=UPI001E56376C|nr:DUF4175 family protein [Tenacibaculum sp. SG-28]
MFIEYFLWLQPSFRTLLFGIFVLVEFILLLRFIAFPIFKLIGLKKGISIEESSKIIGNHFPEIKDKLLNIIQLSNKKDSSDLLLASIEQKSNAIQPISFGKAINFSSGLKYGIYLLIPICIWGVTRLSGIEKNLNQSLDRVLDYKTAYTPPAPFEFLVTNRNLKVLQGNSLKVGIKTIGTIVPEEAKIYYNNQEYYLQKSSAGNFYYLFENISENTSFRVSANGVGSNVYQIQTIKTPSIQNITLNIRYPKYTKRKNKTISNSGTMDVPQGTTITWNVKTTDTDSVTFSSNKLKKYFQQDNNGDYSFTKKIMNDLPYKISTSNSNLTNYENLQFYITTVKDLVPQISVTSNIDSISRGNAQFLGTISDDYGLQKLELIYREVNTDKSTVVPIGIENNSIQNFYFEFPNNIKLKENSNYEIYFKVYDNDRVNGSKASKSRIFYYKQKSEAIIEEELLEEQREYLNKLEKSITSQKKTVQDLTKIQEDLQNKTNLSWNDQKNIKKLLERQKQYQQIMKRQTNLLKENLDEKEPQKETLQEKKENLKKRIEELEKINKEKELLKELEKLAEKLNKEDLVKKTKELAAQNKQKERSLERILEMTKRYYVEQKMNQIANKLEKLSESQEKLENNDTSIEKQKDINKAFKDIQEELEKLKKDNESLKDPMALPEMENLEKEISKELEESLSNLEQNNNEKAKKNQRSSSKKMKEMSAKMKQSMEAMSAEMQEEDMESLRQILENLLLFSFDQETLMETFRNTNSSNPDFGKNIKKQYQLKRYFEHIDDSLFTLSMRVPEISSTIQNELANTHYNLDQSLENFVENRMTAGGSNQQYVMTSANTLADILSNTLDAMQNPKEGMGKGKGKGNSFSLPDIIQKQESLIQKMEDGIKKGEKGKKENTGKDGEKGNSNKGEDDMDGELFEIYKEQSKLRQSLEELLQKGSNGSGDAKAKKAIQELENLENKILEKGFTKENLEVMKKLNYELLKLDTANLEQGKEKQRKTNSNKKEFNENPNKKLKYKSLFYNQNEILNRQSLPLQQKYKKKVQLYFNSSDKI